MPRRLNFSGAMDTRQMMQGFGTFATAALTAQFPSDKSVLRDFHIVYEVDGRGMSMKLKVEGPHPQLTDKTSVTVAELKALLADARRHVGRLLPTEVEALSRVHVWKQYQQKSIFTNLTTTPEHFPYEMARGPITVITSPFRDYTLHVNLAPDLKIDCGHDYVRLRDNLGKVTDKHLREILVEELRRDGVLADGAVAEDRSSGPVIGS